MFMKFSYSEIYLYTDRDTPNNKYAKQLKRIYVMFRVK